MPNEQAPSLVAILDDDRSVQSALRDLIESQGMSALCFDSAEQFLDCGVRDQASCLVADIGMPGMSGLELQARLKFERCGIPIIFITARGDIPLAVSAMKEGASDFLTKPFEGCAFLAAVEHALEMDRNVRRELLAQGALLARYRSLTPREREVLPLLVSGLLNKQTAAELGITEYTVQVHRGHIMRKMRADSFATLVRMTERLNPESPQPTCVALDRLPNLPSATAARAASAFHLARAPSSRITARLNSRDQSRAE